MSIKDAKNDPQEMARIQMLRGILAEIDSYLLDHCEEDQSWEDFDPEIDELRTKVQNLLG